MTISDTLGDLITRIRNSQNARFLLLPYRASKLCINVLRVLKEEGYIQGFVTNGPSKQSDLSILGDSSDYQFSKYNQDITISLKYMYNEPLIKEIKRVSKPGKRVYTSICKLPKAYNGLGIYILSTPKGVLSDRQARIHNVGGEVLCKVL